MIMRLHPAPFISAFRAWQTLHAGNQGRQRSRPNLYGVKNGPEKLWEMRMPPRGLCTERMSCFGPHAEKGGAGGSGDKDTGPVWGLHRSAPSADNSPIISRGVSSSEPGWTAFATCHSLSSWEGSLSSPVSGSDPPASVSFGAL